MAAIFRRFSEELVTLLGRKVSIETSDGKTYLGDLIGIDENLNIILENVSGAGEDVFRLVLNGSFIKQIKLVEKPFDLRALAERLGRVFPGLVKLREDVGAIIVMDKIKVTEEGVVEGTGLAAERVKAVFDEFMKEIKKGKSS